VNEQPHTLHLPRMVEAFEHASGSVAAATPGGCTGWRGTLLHIHIAEAASYEMEELREARCVAGAARHGVVTCERIDRRPARQIVVEVCAKLSNPSV
jgi:hypothetical protein